MGGSRSVTGCGTAPNPATRVFDTWADDPEPVAGSVYQAVVSTSDQKITRRPAEETLHT